MNQVTLIGNVGKDAEFRQFNDGGSVAQFSLATTERGYKLQNGTEVPDHTDWHYIRVQGKLAEIARDYVKKGMKLAVIGKIRYREYEHQGQKRTATEIWASNFEMLGSPDKKNEQPQPQSQQPAQTQQTANVGHAVYPDSVETNDGLPF